MLKIVAAWLKTGNRLNSLQLSRNRIVFLNLLLLGFWFVIFYYFSFLIWEDPGFRLRYPLKGILWQSMAFYPLFAIVGMILAIVGQYRRQFRLVRYGIIVPLTAVLLMTIFALAISPFNYLAFRFNPPNTIADLATEEKINLEPSLTVRNVFFLPESVVFNDIVSWDGTLLTYTTDLRTGKVLSFYSDAYRQADFEVVGAGGRTGIRHAYYEILEENKYVCLYVEPVDNERVYVYLNYSLRACR